MPRPKLPEGDILRTFQVRLAPKSIVRYLKVGAAHAGVPMQEYLRGLLLRVTRLEYLALIESGARLPDVGAIPQLTDEEFERLLATMSPPPRRPASRIIRPAHADAR